MRRMYPLITHEEHIVCTIPSAGGIVLHRAELRSSMVSFGEFISSSHWVLNLDSKVETVIFSCCVSALLALTSAFRPLTCSTGESKTFNLFSFWRCCIFPWAMQGCVQFLLSAGSKWVAATPNQETLVSGNCGSIAVSPVRVRNDEPQCELVTEKLRCNYVIMFWSQDWRLNLKITDRTNTTLSTSVQHVRL